LLNAIATYFGVTLTYDDIVYALLSSDDYYLYTVDDYRLVVQDELNANKNSALDKPLEGTYRDYIGWIAGLVGAFAHMGRNGDLVINQYKDHGFVVGRDVQHMGGAKINYGGSVTYTSIISGTEENPLYPTYYGGNAITYTNPYITQKELDRLCEGLLQVDGITVTPCDVAWRSNPCVDAGDIVSVVDKDGNNLSVYVMERVVRVTGGLAEELHCYGETEVAHTLNKSPLVTSFNNKISEAMKTASDYINNTKGIFEWIDNGDGTNGGFTIYENGSQSWLRCTAGGIGISADGGLTYTNAITKNGVVASDLRVVKNGSRVLMAYVDNTECPQLMMRDRNDNMLMWLRTTYNSETDTGYGQLSIYASNTGMPVFSVTTPYLQSSGEVVGGNVTVSDADGKYGVALRASTYYGDRCVRIFTDTGTDSPIALGWDTINGCYFSYDNHSLSLQTITINGTTYHVLGYT
jgi:hypothetical protein